jgi:hypothetical protein
MPPMPKRFKVQPFGTGVLLTISVEENITVAMHLTAEEYSELLDKLYAAKATDGDTFPSDLQNFPKA